MQIISPEFDRITIDPDVCLGKPCIRGMRMPASTILAYMAMGVSVEMLLLEFPFLEKEDILQVLRFASQILNGN